MSEFCVRVYVVLSGATKDTKEGQKICTRFFIPKIM